MSSAPTASGPRTPQIARTSISGPEGQFDKELEEIRRYEDFSTIGITPECLPCRFLSLSLSGAIPRKALSVVIPPSGCRMVYRRAMA